MFYFFMCCLSYQLPSIHDIEIKHLWFSNVLKFFGIGSVDVNKKKPCRPVLSVNPVMVWTGKKSSWFQAGELEKSSGDR